LPAITGTTTTYVTGTTTLSNTTIGGTWSSSNTAIATVNASGIVTGVAAGSLTITYTLVNGSGCSSIVTSAVAINPFSNP
jgi:uncharacterized protein YjdB